jgi:hypothetical protein
MLPTPKGLELTYQPVGALKSNPRNSRTHSKRQVRQIADSMKAFGFTNPILLDESNTIVAGHGRVEAAKLLGLAQVPTIRLENLSPEQIRAYVIADNRLAEKAGWDKAILAIELQHLLTIESEFDVTVTGFEIPEIDLLPFPGDGTLDGDDVFAVEEISEPVTRAGDLRAGHASRRSVEARQTPGSLWKRDRPEFVCEAAGFEAGRGRVHRSSL